MDLADRIRNLGFKRWYERQLTESVLYLVTCFLCMITVAACLEEFGARDPDLQRVALRSVAVVAGGIGAVSWRRFKEILVRAERMGDHATCGNCGTYARFSVIAAGACAHRPDLRGRDEDPDAEDAWLRVECRKCGHAWTIR